VSGALLIDLDGVVYVGDSNMRADAPSCAASPRRRFFDTALSVLGASASETVMIGDDVIGDVGGAQRAGLRGVLVRTGKFHPADLEGHVRPDGVLDSLASLPERLAGLFDRR